MRRTRRTEAGGSLRLSLRSRAAVAALCLGHVAGFAQAQAAAGSGDAATESIVIQGAFLNSGAQSAMKLDAPIRDTPFSVSSYSDAFMKAIETQNVADMYNYMTGIKRAGNTGYDVVIRGMKSGSFDRNSIVVDGLPGLSGRFGSPPTIAVEHIELVKGPMSVLYGQAQPGGFINMVSKKPKAAASTELDIKGTGFIGHGLSLADANGFDVAIDSTGPIDEKKKFLYRFVGNSVKRDLFSYGSYEQSAYLAPSITWNVDDTTLLTAQFEYRNTTNAYDTGLVAANNEFWRLAQVDIKTRYQEPNDYRTEEGKTLTLSGEHTFANDMKLAGSFRMVRSRDLTEGLGVVGSVAPFTTIQRRAAVNRNRRTYSFGDLNLAVPFKTGTVEHKVLAGLNGGRETSDFNRGQFFTRGLCPPSAVIPCYDIDLLHPVYGTVRPAPTGGVYNAITNPTATAFGNLASSQYDSAASTSAGVYASDLVTLNAHWKATLGVRATHETIYSEERAIPGVAPRAKSADSVLPMAGLLYQPTKQWTLYSSYSTSFSLGQPTLQDADGRNSFKPEKGKQVEVGVKAEDLWNGRATGTLSLFRIDKKDAIYSTACNSPSLSGCSGQVGAERSQGLELELNVRPLDSWQLSGGYAYTDATVRASPIALQVNQHLVNVARNSANVWSRYDVPAGPLKGFGIGIGLTYTGARPGPLPTVASTATTPNTFTLPAYTVADLGLYYTVSRYAFTLRFGNVFDKTYYESTGFFGNASIVAGMPRNVALSMRTTF